MHHLLSVTALVVMVEGLTNAVDVANGSFA